MLLNRKQLGSIEQVDLKPLSEEEMEARNARIATAYGDIEEVIATAIKDQSDFTVRNSEGEFQISFGRGGINTAELILDTFKKMKEAHDERGKPREEFNKFNVI